MGIMFKETWHNPPRIVCHILAGDVDLSNPALLHSHRSRNRQEESKCYNAFRVRVCRNRRLYVRVKCNFCSFVGVSSTL